MAATQTPIRGRLSIAGEWSSPRDDFESLNPANLTEVIGKFPAATASEVNAAVDAARAAFPAWRATSRIHRAECFDRLAQLIKRDTDALAELMARECGKNILECRAEVIEGLHMVQYVFGTARAPFGEIIASEIAEKDAFVRRKPWGVVAVITPWNFPFAVPLWMLGPSLQEGNTCVFKPSEDTPGIGQRLVELFEEAGFPRGTVNLLHGAGETGAALVKNPGVNVVGFTGSYDVGRKIQEVSAKLPDRIVAAEMGGKNAVIVCQDARFDLAVSAGILSAFKTTGQRCVSASRILVHESVIDRYAKAFVWTARHLKFGDPLDPKNFAGPVIHRESVEKILGYNALAAKEGATVLLDGGEIPLSKIYHDRRDDPACFLSPFVYRAEHRPDMRVLKEEVFGPHVALIPFRDDEHAARIANDTEYGLSMAVITEDYRRQRFFREACDYGMGYVNLPCIGAEVHLPFGGVKKSGNGHPSAAALVDAVTHKTAWTVNHATEIKMAQGLTAAIEEDDAEVIPGGGTSTEPEHEAPVQTVRDTGTTEASPEVKAMLHAAKALPRDLQKQVADFAAFLVQKYTGPWEAPTHAEPPAAVITPAKSASVPAVAVAAQTKAVADPVAETVSDDDEVDLGGPLNNDDRVDMSGVFTGLETLSSIGLT